MKKTQPDLFWAIMHLVFTTISYQVIKVQMCYAILGKKSFCFSNVRSRVLSSALECQMHFVTLKDFSSYKKYSSVL